MGVGLFVGVWIARYLGPEQFGLLSYATALSGLFVAVSGLGFHQILIRDAVRNPEQVGKTFGTAALLQFAAGALCYAALLSTVHYLRADNALARMVVAVLGLSLVFKATEIAVVWFESQVQSKYTVWVQNGCFLVFAGIKITLILQQAPLLAFAWATILQALIAGLILLLVMHRKGLPVSNLSFNWQRGKQLLGDSWPLILSAVAVTIYLKVDQIMLGQMVGDDAVGIYSAAVRISEVWYFVPTSIVASLFPAILRTKERDENLYYDRLQRLYDFLTIIGMIVAVTITFIGNFLITTLFGSDYSEGGSILVIHIWCGIFVAMGVARGSWLLTEGLQYMSYWYLGIGVILNVILNYIFIPIYGPIGAAWTSLISQIVMAILAPALFTRTRIMSRMLIKALNPLHLWKSAKYAFNSRISEISI